MQTAPNDIQTISGRRVAVLAAADLYVLGRFMPRWTSLVADLSQPQRWVQQVGTDRATTTIALALLWLAACWLAVGIAAAGASRLPGQVGRIASVATGRLMPRLLQRLLVTAASASIVLTPVAALAATPTPAANPSQSIVLVLPTDSASVPVTPGTAAPAAPSSATPAAAAPKVAAPAATAPARAAAPNAVAPAKTPSSPTMAEQVLVRSGDSLWTIAARELGAHPDAARIAAAWPRLYAANRNVIGADPNLLRTGEHLIVPTSIEGK